MAFWLVLIGVFVFAGGRRRRWERWARMDARYFHPGHVGHPWGPEAGRLASAERDSYVEQLETRVARLEERLDFTEKLLEERARQSPE
jgi:hypothetical protein